MNKKQTNIAWIIGISIIVLIVILPQINIEKFMIGSESDLTYKIHDSGTCKIIVEDSSGTRNNYTIRVDTILGADQKTIYTKFDGTPALPVPTSFNDFGYNYCSLFGLENTLQHYWGLANSGTLQIIADYCPNGASDPDPNDGVVSYKCNQYCKPSSSICVSNTSLAVCSTDGARISHQDCPYGCDDNICKSLENTLSVDTDQVAYSLGEDVKVNGSFKSANGAGIEGITVKAELLRGTGTIDQQVNTTDANGLVSFKFTKPTAGETYVRLYIESYGGSPYYSLMKQIMIIGNTIQFNVSTYSPIQYSSNPITFLVQMTNSRGLPVVPEEIDNIRVVASMTSGTVSSSDWTYKGNGLYEGSTIVNGSGRYTGKFSFDYEGIPQSSFPLAEIEVRPMSIDIDASQIGAGAYINEEHTYTIQTFDTSGAIVNPENLFITISLPDGVTKREIPFSSMTKVSDGTYTFTYTFDQLEKHTFDIYADYKNYARGSARASVAVSSPTDDFGPGIQGIGSKLKYAFYIGIAAVAIYLIIKFGKKKKK